MREVQLGLGCTHQQAYDLMFDNETSQHLLIKLIYEVVRATFLQLYLQQDGPVHQAR